MQAMPQLTDQAKLPNIVDPVIKDTMDLKHLYQVYRTINYRSYFSIWLVFCFLGENRPPNFNFTVDLPSQLLVEQIRDFAWFF